MMFTVFAIFGGISATITVALTLAAILLWNEPETQTRVTHQREK